jgi:predicted nucleotidyltransferase
VDKESVLKKLTQQRHFLKSYQVKAISLFGSVARGDEASGSDVDLLVEFEPTAQIGMFEFIRLRRELSQILRCDVDLATPGSLHKSMKKDILREAIRAA